MEYCAEKSQSQLIAQAYTYYTVTFLWLEITVIRLFDEHLFASGPPWRAWPAQLVMRLYHFTVYLTNFQVHKLTKILQNI